MELHDALPIYSVDWVRTPRQLRPHGVLGAFSDKDKCLTRIDDGRLVKFYQDQNCCHTYGCDVAEGHSSATCIYPDMCHEILATAENPMDECLLYKRIVA